MKNTFDAALIALKEGKQVTRSGWNGAGQFVYMLPGSEIQRAAGYGFGEYMGEPSFVSTLVLRTAQNNLVCGWVPSIGDLMAADWHIYGEEPSTLPEHVQRMQVELETLDGNIQRLGSFFNNPIFNQLPEEDRNDMTRQHELMQQLREVLHVRTGRAVESAK